MDSISSSREKPIDRISSLPDPLLVHILSFLDMCEAVQTGILSSRWRGLWSSVPSLHFNQYQFNGYKEFNPTTDEYPHQRYDKFAFQDDIDFDNYYDEEDDDEEEEDEYDDAGYYGYNFHDTDDFIKFVDHSLALHVAPKVNKFSLTCSYSKKFESFIDGWILSAVRRDVKEVKLEFPECIGGLYNLPSWLFKCECLISLSLKGCPVGVPQSVCLSSLLSLSISLTRMSVGSIPQLLTGCPLLEELVLNECQFSSGTLRILSLSSTSELRLKRLTIAWCTNQFDLQICFQIRAPYLEMLKISGIHPFDNSMKNLLNLREAHLDFSGGGWTPSVESCLKDLHHVRVIGLSRQCIKILSELGERYQPPYSSKTKCLILESELRRSELPGIANLLWRSHDLENLIIKLTTSPSASERPEKYFDNEYWGRLEFSFPCISHRLLTVKILGFMERKCESTYDCDVVSSFFEMQDTEMEIVRFFLTNAAALKKMTIQFCDKPDFLEGEEWSKILLMVFEKFNAIPRASSCAELSLLYK
ncbi:hypothetical protein MRB53_030910 [Persea americana]|uniref:Uncharacterized protein n=1 Tax=Persea americana TaxID=3435 RepID=A0ACC2KMN7_PERAE|nr:hypothetical protein MRB53_030910 [Persea americana]